MTEGPLLSYAVNTPAVPTSGSQRLVYLLLEVKHTDGNADLLPVNLGLAVDVSASMHVHLADDAQFRELARMGVLRQVLVDGMPAWRAEDIPAKVLARLSRKIDRVGDALRAAVEQLRPNDRFSLVAFAEQATTLIPSTPGAEKSRLLEVIDRLERLQVGDDTYIGEGMRLSLEELQSDTSSRHARRLIVLTDGFTRDEEECQLWATAAYQAHIPISTMGLGGEFNEEVMIPVADRTGGEAYLLENPRDIPDAFAEELQRAQAIRYRNLELKLRTAQGVLVRAAYRVLPSIAPLEVTNEDRSFGFPLGDLIEGEEPSVLLELIVPPRPAGIYRLLQALLACDDPSGSVGGLKTRADVVVQYSEDPVRTAQLVPKVMHIVEALSAYKLQRRAQTDLRAGDKAGATRKLRAAATRLLDMGQNELAAEVHRQVAELEQWGTTDSRRTKKLRYETRKLTRQLNE